MSTWTIDPVHSTVEYVVAHLGMPTFRGKFKTMEGTITLDEENPVNSSVTATIEAASMDIPGDRFYGHIAGADFFDIENHPKITFTSTGVEKVSDTRWNINGDLTIKGNTRPVTLDTEFLGQAVHPFSKKHYAAFEASTNIDRTDFGIKWNVPMDNGMKYVGERVKVSLIIEAVKQEEAAPA